MTEIRTSVEESIPCADGAVWIGAASFEERCIGGLNQIQKAGIRLEIGVVLNYGSTPRESKEVEERRTLNRQYITKRIADMSEKPALSYDLHAYSYSSLENAAKLWLNAYPGTLIIDITCMTKIHTIALAGVIGRQQKKRHLIIQYSIPENYSGIPRQSPRPDGWRDIIVAPFSEYARFFNEGGGRGIVLLGHEADRVVMALAEIEPAGGVIITSYSNYRPDLKEESKRRNAKIVQQLLTMRSFAWTNAELELIDAAEVSRVVSSQVALAQKKKAPVILFPFGPKCLIFGSALELAIQYYDNAWFVYPIPASYDPFYTEGIGLTYNLAVDPISPSHVLSRRWKFKLTRRVSNEVPI